MLYQILKADGGAVVALVDELRFIKQSPTSTSKIAANEADAQGIAVAGTAYNLLGREPMEGLETVEAVKVDGGTVVFEQGETQASTDTFVFSDQYMHWDGIKWVFSPENPIPLLRLPFANGIPNAFYRFTDGKRYVYVFEDRGPITEENFNEVMELWDIDNGESEGE